MPQPVQKRPKCPLSTWIDSHFLNQREFAAKAGVSPAALSHFIRGVRGMRKSSIAKLSAATGGEVTEIDLLVWMRGGTQEEARALPSEARAALLDFGFSRPGTRRTKPVRAVGGSR